MSEETTRDLPNAGSFEERILTELAAMRADFTDRFNGLETRLNSLEDKVDVLNSRLTTLEDRVDARLRETRPIWEGVKMQLDRLESKFDIVAADLLETRIDQAQLAKRVTKLEERTPA